MVRASFRIIVLCFSESLFAPHADSEFRSSLHFIPFALLGATFVAAHVNIRSNARIIIAVVVIGLPVFECREVFLYLLLLLVIAAHGDKNGTHKFLWRHFNSAHR